MGSDKDTLLSMGFDPSRVEWALKATGGRGLQPAMDHILEHEADPVPDLANTAVGSAAPAAAQNAMDVDDDEDNEALRAALKLSQAPDGGASSGAADAPAEAGAKSIKCTECGKIFRNVDEANYHATKSGHDQFEESTEEKKPLTEEERLQKLAELKERMSEKRAKKAAAEAEEAKANEAIRRKAGQDQGKAKEDLKLKQAQKEAEQKKREKAEDAKARAAIKAQIEADKRERAAKIAREKAQRDGTADPTAASSSASPLAAARAAPAAAAGAVAGRDFKDTRLQIRFATGGVQPLTTTLPSDSPLRAVAEFVAGQSLSFDVETVKFTQHFPRKQFTQADMNKSLRDLGLTPSAVLIAE